MKRGIIFITLQLMVFSMVSYGKKLATLPGLFKPYFIIMDNEQLYVCDGALVSIYSLKDFSLISRFGKEGEGPEEFKLSPSKDGLFVHPQTDYLLISSIRKASFYTIEGKFIKEMRVGNNQIVGNYQTIGNKFAGLDSNLGGDLSMVFTINIFDDKFTKIKGIYKQDFMERGSMTFPMVYPLFFVEDNKIIAPADEAFTLNIFDADGNKISGIHWEYKRLKVKEDYKKGVHQFFKTDPGTKQYYEVFFKKLLKFSDYFPAIQFFTVDNGKIYIQTYLEKDDKYEFFIYDLKGTFLKRLFLPVAYLNVFMPQAYTIKNNTLYQLIENEDEEEWELHAVEIK
ncbi:MAG: hypothetical protein KAT34_01970 [Candidatus Aminicenantes bacterium]|nr:hypothetical protein [Candidatus Aminicenantes bacterium]